MKKKTAERERKRERERKGTKDRKRDGKSGHFTGREVPREYCTI